MKNLFGWIFFIPIASFFALIPWVFAFFLLAPFGLVFNVDNSWADASQKQWYLVAFINLLMGYGSVVLWLWAGMQFSPKNLRKHVRRNILILLSLLATIPALVLAASSGNPSYAIYYVFPAAGIATAWLPRFRQQLIK